MSKRVCMLLTDPKLSDYRVICEATSLTDAGYTVRLIMPTQNSGDYSEQVNGFEVCYVQPLLYSRRLLLQFLVTRSWRKGFETLSAAYQRQVKQSSVQPAPPPSESVSGAIPQPQPGVGGRIKSNLRGTAKTIELGVKKAIMDFCVKTPSLIGILREYVLLLQEVAFASKAREFRPDIIHAHDLETLRLGRLLAEEMDAKLVYDAHEFYPFQSFLKASAKYWLKRELSDIRSPNIILTVNPFLAKVMEEQYGVEKIHVIQNTVPYQDSSVSREIGRARLTKGLSIPHERFCVLLSLGYLAEGRGLIELVEALALLPDYYVLAVLGDGRARGQMEQHVRDLDLGRRVVFHGMVPREQVQVLTGGADVGLFTIMPGGLHDTYVSTNRLGDYVVAGLPLAMTDLPFLRWFVEHYRCGVLFDTSDPHDIAQKIRWLFDDPQRFEDFRQNTLEAGKEFNWDVESQKFLELYASLN